MYIYLEISIFLYIYIYISNDIYIYSYTYPLEKLWKTNISRMRNWTSFSQPILGGDMLVLRRAIAFLHGACLHVPKIYWNSQHECRCHWAPYIPLNATNCYRYLHKLLFIAVALFQLPWWHTVTVILKKWKNTFPATWLVEVQISQIGSPKLSRKKSLSPFSKIWGCSPGPRWFPKENCGDSLHPWNLT